VPAGVMRESWQEFGEGGRDCLQSLGDHCPASLSSLWTKPEWPRIANKRRPPVITRTTRRCAGVGAGGHLPWTATPSSRDQGRKGRGYMCSGKDPEVRERDRKQPKKGGKSKPTKSDSSDFSKERRGKGVEDTISRKTGRKVQDQKRCAEGRVVTRRGGRRVLPRGEANARR